VKAAGALVAKEGAATAAAAARGRSTACVILDVKKFKLSGCFYSQLLAPITKP